MQRAAFWSFLVGIFLFVSTPVFADEGVCFFTLTAGCYGRLNTGASVLESTSGGGGFNASALFFNDLAFGLRQPFDAIVSVTGVPVTIVPLDTIVRDASGNITDRIPGIPANQCQRLMDSEFLPFDFQFGDEPPGVYQITIQVLTCAGQVIASSTADLVVFPPPPPPPQLFRMQVTDLAGDELSRLDFNDATVTATQQILKLGEEARIFLFPVGPDGTEGALLSATETLTDAVDQSPNDSQVFSTVTKLFGGQVLVHFPHPGASQFQSQFHRIFPVHSGTANVHITFQSQGNSYNVTLPIKVTNCSAGDCTSQLGATHPEFDDLLMKFADRNGIPPQLLKAQIAQESSFVPNAYRYEPLSVDFGQIAAPLRGGAPFGLLQQQAFAPWALAQSSNCSTISVAQGSQLNLSSGDATARQKYAVTIDQSGRPICRVTDTSQVVASRGLTPSDTVPSMENVLYTNDNDQSANNWVAVAVNAGSPTPQRFFDYQVDHPPFTAQTVIAASYGLHQVMYQTAIQMKFTDANKIGLPPGNLFIPAISLDLGSQYLAIQFVVAEKKFEATVGEDYQDEDTFFQQFGPALRGFNGVNPTFTVSDFQSECGGQPPAPLNALDDNFVYACKAVRNAPQFAPVPVLPSPTGGTGGSGVPST